MLPKVYETGKFASIPQLQEYLGDDSKKLPKESVSDSEDNLKTILTYKAEMDTFYAIMFLNFHITENQKAGKGNIPNVMKAISLLKHK